MADYLASNFKVYQEYLKTRAAETLQQNADVFNAAVNNGIILRTVEKPGDYEYESFFKDIASLVTRRDNTSTSSAAKLSMLQEEFVRVKINRKIGPVDQSRDSFRKVFARYSEMEFSGILGGQIAVAQQLDMLNTVLLAAGAAIANVSALKHTVASAGTMTTSALIDGLSKMGDRADRIVCWVMHSKVYFDLVKDQLAANVDGLSVFNVRTGTPITLNRPVIVTDSPSLVKNIVSPDVSDYYTLGLVSGGALAEVTETSDIVIDDVTGLEVLMTRLQGEFAYNIGLKGFKYATGNGINPNDTIVGTGATWTKVASDDKSLAGVVIQSR